MSAMSAMNVTPPGPRVRAAARGMTLVELMVGMAVGLFVVLIAVAIFVSTRTLHSVGSASTRMSENARLAMDVLQTDIRNAAFVGCKPLLNDSPIIVLLAGDGGFLSTGPGMMGYRGTGAGFTPALTGPLAALPAASAPLATSDVLSVRVPADMPGLGIVAAMASTLAAPQVAASSPANTLAMGDIVLLASCKASTMFQITEANPAATGVLTHGIGGSFTPGNATDDLQQRFRTDATVYKMETRHYYVAPSALRPGTSSLYRLVVPGSGSAEEVASGVDRLVITYGIDGAAAAGQQNVDHYAAADGVTAWDRVIAVRLQMLVATAKDGVTRTAQSVDFAGSAVAFSDRRLRSALTEVVTVRNGAP
ncbi:MAG TPA: PilW family protein [Caldimonas sp.]|nr:PilW family protein [Caldimonas sp.]HEV7574680.1 PilW family protein [Caldimonas sp.]